MFPRIVLTLCLLAAVTRRPDPSTYNQGLTQAVAKQDNAAVQQLLSAGANPNLVYGHAPMLFLSAAYGDIATVKVLLNYGANPNGYTDTGENALDEAIHCGSVAMAKLLIAKGADINGRSVDNNPLTRAAFVAGRDPSALLTLLNAPKHPVTRGQVRAIRSAAAQIFQILLARGADPNHADSAGGTPLIEAAEDGRVDLCRMLVKSGADPNLVTVDGSSALSLAAAGNRAGIVSFLLAHGAQRDAVDPHGKTALLLAMEQQSASSTTALENAGATLLFDKQYVDAGAATSGRLAPAAIQQIYADSNTALVHGDIQGGFAFIADPGARATQMDMFTRFKSPSKHPAVKTQVLSASSDAASSGSLTLLVEQTITAPQTNTVTGEPGELVTHHTTLAVWTQTAGKWQCRTCTTAQVRSGFVRFAVKSGAV